MIKQNTSMWKRLVIYFLIGGVGFSLGYLAKNQRVVSGSEDKITVIGPNQAIQNSLSKMNIEQVVGVTKVGVENGFGEYGQLYYFVNDDKSTEIHIRLNQIPDKVSSNDESGPSKNIPRVLDIKLARRVFDDSNFDYQNIGKIKLDPEDNKLLSGKYSTVLPAITDRDGKLVPALSDVERVVFDTDSAGAKNIFQDKNADLPATVRNEPSPFFWVVVTTK
jgi:hypothetical protein